MILPLLLTIGAANGVLSSFLSKCKASDHACLQKTLNDAVAKLMNGIPELGIEKSDPLFLEEVRGDVTNLKYKFINVTVTGYKDCTITDFILSQDLSSVKYNWNCPQLDLKGKYEIKGSLVILPIEGAGDFEIITGKNILSIEAELSKIQGKDGKDYLKVKNFKLKSTILSPNKYDFKNLFNGQKDLSDAAHKFAHENWREVAELVQDPSWYAALKKIMSYFNKALKTQPVEDIFLP